VLGLGGRGGGGFGGFPGGGAPTPRFSPRAMSVLRKGSLSSMLPDRGPPVHGGASPGGRPSPREPIGFAIVRRGKGPPAIAGSGAVAFERIGCAIFPSRVF